MVWSKEKILAAALLFAVIWAALLSLFISQIETLSHLWQFLLVTAVFYALPAIVFGQLTTNNGWIRKTAGAFLLFSAFDLLAPPLAVSLDGTISTTATLSGGAIDVVLGEFWAGMGLNGILLWFATYPATFILLIAAATFLLTERQIWDILRHL